MDIALTYYPGPPGEVGYFDIGVQDGDFVMDDGLESAVWLSLFTDARAREEDGVPEGEPRRGWWAANVGSRLWTLLPARQTQETRLKAKGYCEEALQWLLDNSIASRVEVACEWVRDGVLGIRIEITKADGTVVRYEFTWDTLRRAA